MQKWVSQHPDKHALHILRRPLHPEVGRGPPEDQPWAVRRRWHPLPVRLPLIHVLAKLHQVRSHVMDIWQP